MNPNWRLTMLVPAIAMFSAGCEIKKTADDMKRTTRRMEGSTRHLEKRTDDLEHSMTYKESDATITEDLDRLFGEAPRDNIAVIKTAWNYFFGVSDEPDLFKDAGTVILAMHWQFWKGDYNDSMAELDGRLMWSIESLFLRLSKYAPRDGHVDVLRPDRGYRGIGALGAKMDVVSDRTHSTFAAVGLPDSLYYNLMINALRNRNATSRTEQFPRATAKALQWEPEVVYLLQMRHNFLPIMVVARMTDLQERGDARRLWMAMTGQSVNLNLINPERLKEYTVWLERASQTRADLLSVGIAPQYNKMLATLVRNVDFGQKAILARPMPLASDERGQIELRFARAYQKAVDEATPKTKSRPLPANMATLGGRRR